MAVSNDNMTFLEEDNKMAASGNKMAGAGDAVYDVVVVGAGLAGLSTVHNLIKKDPTLKVLLLEARDRVGGRTFNRPLKVRGGGTENFDLGAQWVGSTQHHVLALIKELGMEIYPQHSEGTKVTQLGSSKIRTFTSDKPTIGSWFALAEYKLFMRKMDRLAEKVPMEDPYSSELSYELEGHTVASYAALSLWTQAARDAVDQSVKGVYGTDASRLGMLFFLAYTNASGGMEQLYGIKDSAQAFRVKLGTQEISNKLAAVVGRDKILLSQAVTAVEQTEQGDLITVTHRRCAPDTNILEGAPSNVRARRVVMAAPPNLVKNIRWTPPLHTLKQFTCDNLQMGHLYKFIVTYEESHWRNKGYSGEAFSNGGAKIALGCSTGPVVEVYDTTTVNGSPAIVGFFAGRGAVEWTQKTKIERAAAVSATLAAFFKAEEMKNFLDYEDKMWFTDPWTGGCPVMYGTPGTLFSMPMLRAPHGGVHFAGTETASVWMGYMSGAIASGERTALEALAFLKPHLLTEEQHKEAKRTSHVREPFIAQPPPTVACGLLTSLAAVGVATALGLYFLRQENAAGFRPFSLCHRG